MTKRVYTLSMLLYATGILYAALMGMARPMLNWDMLPYVGSVISYQTHDKDEIYRLTMAAVKPAVPPEIYKSYEDNPVSHDAEAFYRQLPIKQIKPLYVGTLWFLHQLGAGLAKATWLVSALAFAMLGAALALWRPQYADRSVWLLSLLLLTFAGDFPMQALAAFSTPDCLSLAFLMAAFIAWNRWGSAAGYIAGSLLGILARPDAVMQVLAVTFWLVFFAERRLSPMKGVALGIAALGVCGAISIIFHAMNWKTLFYLAFININYDYVHLPVVLTREQYWTALAWGFSHQIQETRLQVFAGLSVIALWLQWMHRATSQWLWLLAMAWGVSVVRFALFPVWSDERFYYWFYLFTLMACLEIIAAPKASPSSSASA